MLKRFFKQSDPVPVDLLAIRSSRVVLQSDVQLDPGPLEAEAHVSGVGPVRMRLQVFEGLETYGALQHMIAQLGFEPRAHLYTAQVLHPPGAAGHLARVLWPLPDDVPDCDRSSLRVERRFRVRSRQLPGFRAVALDISPTGIRLEVDGWVEPGRSVELHVEIDDKRIRPLDVEAVVRWCEQQGTRHLLGASFEGLTERSQGELEEFIRACLESEPGILKDTDLR